MISLFRDIKQQTSLVCTQYTIVPRLLLHFDSIIILCEQEKQNLSHLILFTAVPTKNTVAVENIVTQS